ncbi:MAG: thioredoxin family protein [Bacteroidetes bacterium]|nr:thioredoxin family protein [Bacteroidota bacterium]
MEIQECVDKGKTVLLEFSAEWCSSCQTMEPILNEIKNIIGDSIEFLKIDIDKSPQIIPGFLISSVPTFIFYNNGKMLWRRVGLLSKKELLMLIQMPQEKNIKAKK